MAHPIPETLTEHLPGAPWVQSRKLQPAQTTTWGIEVFACFAQVSDNQPSTEDNPFLRAYPNPGKTPVYLVYDMPEGVERAEIQVVDINGKLLLTRILAPRPGILELDQLPTGLNVASLYCDGIRIGVVKLSIVK